MRYVDVNVFVYWLGDDTVFGEEATGIIERIEKGEKAVTATITPWLVHVVLQGMGRGYSEKKMIERLDDVEFLRMEPLTWNDYGSASKCMETYKLDLEDSLHLAIAQRLGILEIYSNDGDFSKTSVKPIGFKRLAGKTEHRAGLKS